MDIAPDSAISELRFGTASLDLHTRKLVINGQPAKLSSRAFDLLVALIERRSRTVSKNELFDLVWPGLVVEENNLQVHVSALRKLLGPNTIATIPGRGYRFTANVDSPAANIASIADAVTPAAAPANTNLPVQCEPLYGREQDLGLVGQLLKQHSQVSIVGAGGIGKTRLALAIADAQREHFPDGVWWIELATLGDSHSIVSAIAQALGIRASGEQPLFETVIALLRNQHALLVLDNCEHLLAATAKIVRTLLPKAPNVRVLVTSQAALHTPNEQVYLLEPLSTEGIGPSDYGPAVELFIARARSADPHLRFSAGELTIAREICRQLDGVPLAIELAAARVRLLGLDGLRKKLSQRFHVLTGRNAATISRHRTLLDALEWSHGLLSQDEQTVFRRLAVFVGGFTLELAQVVASDNDIDGWAVLDLLGGLVEKSLVVVDRQMVPRYRLLETMRAFALEKLAEAGEVSILVRRHAEALLTLVKSASDRRSLISREEHIRLRDELDNLRAALSWAESQSGDRALGCALIASTRQIWFVNDLFHEGIERALRLLPLPVDLSPEIEAGFNLTLAALGTPGARQECFVASLRAVELYRSLQDTSSLFDALFCSIIMACHRAEPNISDALSEAETLIGHETPHRQLANMAVAKSENFARLGQYERAFNSAMQQAAIYRDAHNEVGLQIALSNAARYECGLGRFDSAISRLHNALEILQRINAPYVASPVWVDLACAYAMRGDRTAALRYGQDALPVAQRMGWTAWLLLCIALIHARNDEEVRAACLASYFDTAYARTGQIPIPMEADVRNEIQTRALAALPQTKLDHCTAVGSAMSEDRAIEVAFDTDRRVDELIVFVC